MRSAYLQIIRICNQDCIFCAQPQNGNIMTLEEILNKLVFYKKEWVKKIILTWGEPTLHKDLSSILRLCEKFWFEIILQTNWSLLYKDEIIDKLKWSRWFEIMISLHSHKWEIHDKLKNSIWSFNNTINWIKKINNDLKIVNIKIAIAVCKLNLPNFKQTIKFILKEFPYIKGIIINNLDAFNIPNENLDIVSKLHLFDKNFLEWLWLILNSWKTLNIERVPLCYLEWFESYSDSLEYILGNDTKYVHYLQNDREGFFLWKEARTPKWSFWIKCSICDLKWICWWIPRLWELYDESELNPKIISKERINEILNIFYKNNNELN